MLPFFPSVQGCCLRKDDQTSVSVAMDQAPASEEFNQMVGVALGLGQTFGDVGMVFFSADAVVREIGRGYGVAFEIFIGGTGQDVTGCSIVSGRIAGLQD